MLVQLEIIPVGSRSTSVSQPLAIVAQLIHESGLDYRIGPMGTTIEGEWDAVMALAKRCHEALFAVADRVMTFIQVDDRRDKAGPRLQQKVDSLERAVGFAIKR
jgi:uncharacterized protein (TIGR00106 family)